jgi:hypothetical protein
MGKKDDGLAADASLAVEHTPEREAEQLSYFGGDVDDIDDYDPTGLDDGSDPDFVAPDDDDDGEAKDDDTEDSDADPEGDTDDDADADEKAADGDEVDPEESDAADADDDSEDEDEADPEPEPAQKGIPKRRFDEVNEEKKALRVENENLKAQIEAGKPIVKDEPVFDIRAGEKEYMDLLLDGDTESALAKREEIDAAKEAKWKSETRTETKTDIEQDAERDELLSLSQEAQTMFDVFNPDHEDYSQAMLNKVVTFMSGYEATGDMTRGDAFVAGLADVVEMYDLLPDEEAADTDTPKPTGKKKVVDKSKLKAAAHTPVVGEGEGSSERGAVVPNIEEMTDEELDALPEKTLARMRGDFL